MNLLEYLKTLTADERKAFAGRCDTSIDYLFQIAHGHRQPKAQLAVAIERESGRAVRCESLLPAVDWAYLRSAAA